MRAVAADEFLGKLLDSSSKLNERRCSNVIACGPRLVREGNQGALSLRKQLVRSLYYIHVHTIYRNYRKSRSFFIAMKKVWPHATPASVIERGPVPSQLLVTSLRGSNGKLPALGMIAGIRQSPLSLEAYVVWMARKNQVSGTEDSLRGTFAE